MRQCQADLRRARVSFQVLPDRHFGGGCDATASVKLMEIGTPVTNLGCDALPAGARLCALGGGGRAARLREQFDQPLRRIESFGTYACRGVNGATSGRLSEHAHANAVDIAAFVLADGTRITVKDGWYAPTSACGPICARCIGRRAGASASCWGRTRTPLTTITSISTWRRGPIAANPPRFPAGARPFAKPLKPMTDSQFPTRVFSPAKEEAETAAQQMVTPQTSHPAYRLAFQDPEFLLRDDLRSVRFQLELLKPELLLNEAGIGSTFVFYGSARIPSPEHAAALVAAAGDDRERAIAERLAAKARYYDEARKLAALASRTAPSADGKRQFVVSSGGGPSIMEAANRGAADVGAESIGLNIVLPFEQAPNPYVTPKLSFQFHYFALRKMHFLLRARAVAVFPGGFGTFDETFELLTLVQTRKMAPMPILFYGREFWERVVDFNALVDEGVISARDLDLFCFVETAEEGWAKVQEYWAART
jgi:uncharacterized protein (TIGR00730 family)